MSTLKVDTIDTSNSSGNITVSRPLAGSGASLTALNATELTSGTIPIARIADDAVTLAKMADDAIGVAQLSATGTASNSVFLRGDNSWATAGSTSASDLSSGTLPMARLSGTLPALNGSALTALNATNLGSGTVPTARLGTGTANSSVHLRGDGTWAAAGGGKILQVVSGNQSTESVLTGTTAWTATSCAATITPASTSNNVLVMFSSGLIYQDTANTDFQHFLTLYREGSNIGPANGFVGTFYAYDIDYNDIGWSTHFTVNDDPQTTSAREYKIYQKNSSTACNTIFNNQGYSSIHLLEIEG